MPNYDPAPLCCCRIAACKAACASAAATSSAPLAMLLSPVPASRLMGKGGCMPGTSFVNCLKVVHKVQPRPGGPQLFGNFP